MASPSARADVATGVLFMLLSAAGQALMSLFAHVAESVFGLPVSSLYLVRTAMSLATSFLYLLFAGRLSDLLTIPRSAVVPLLLRSIVGSGGGLTLFFSLAFIPAGKAVTLVSMSPILTATIAALLFEEAFSVLHVLALLTNFCGIYFVVSSHGAAEQSASHLDESSKLKTIGVILGILAACCNTVVALSIKRLGGRIHPVVITVGYSIGCVLILPFVVHGNWAGTISALGENHAGFAAAVASALSGFATQTFLALGLSHAPAGVAVVVRTLNVPIVFMLALVFLGETASMLNGVGVVLVLGSVIFITLLNQRGYGRRGSETHILSKFSERRNIMDSINERRTSYL